jgi:hypothetical protein
MGPRRQRHSWSTDPISGAYAALLPCMARIIRMNAEQNILLWWKGGYRIPSPLAIIEPADLLELTHTQGAWRVCSEDVAAKFILERDTGLEQAMRRGIDNGVHITQELSLDIIEGRRGQKRHLIFSQF